MIQQYLTDKECASRYCVSRDTIWRWKRNGEFPKPIKLGEACTRWKLQSLEEWEEAKERAA